MPGLRLSEGIPLVSLLALQGRTLRALLTSAEMMLPILFVPGTWQVSRDGQCATADAFYAECERRRLPIFDPDTPGYWWWSTALDGLLGENTEWEEAAASLVQYVHALGNPPLTLVSFSHGGNVALRAARDLRVDLLVTVATPVRRDVRQWIREARGNVRRWMHVYGPSEAGVPWQRLGQFMDGVMSLAVTMKWADENVAVPGASHGGLLASSVLWDALERWRALHAVEDAGRAADASRGPAA